MKTAHFRIEESFNRWRKMYCSFGGKTKWLINAEPEKEIERENKQSDDHIFIHMFERRSEPKRKEEKKRRQCNKLEYVQHTVSGTAGGEEWDMGNRGQAGKDDKRDIKATRGKKILDMSCSGCAGRHSQERGEELRVCETPLHYSGRYWSAHIAVSHDGRRWQKREYVWKEGSCLSFPGKITVD